MVQVVLKWLKVHYEKVITSIAFLPAIIAIAFLIVSYGMISFDFSPAGKAFKANLHWLSLKDASTARSICSTIAGGIISLAVFSFSMVMILLNQAASQMTNRILGKLIGNRFQQVVLGFYIGTIVYALFLLSTIRDINSGIYVPAISTYLLIALTIADIFLFIYFLHYITESVKYETIIHRIHDNTMAVMKRSCMPKKKQTELPSVSYEKSIGAHKSGLYQGFDKNSLITLCKKKEITILCHYAVGKYVLEGSPLLSVSKQADPAEDFKEELAIALNIGRGQEIDKSYTYGFTQLMEIAIKALSPGINDPGTAIMSLHTLGDLLAFRLEHHPDECIKDDDGVVRIIVKEKCFDEIFKECILPIWDYGKNDRLVQQEMKDILTQLKMQVDRPIISILLHSVELARSNVNIQ